MSRLLQKLGFSIVSPVNVGESFLKAVKAGNGPSYLRALRDTGRLEKDFPEFHICSLTPGGDKHNELVFDHLVNTLEAASDYKYYLKLACLYHDIGKSETYKCIDNQTTFYRHDVVGARIAFKSLKRLGLEIEGCEYVSWGTRYHMFRFEEVTTDKTIRHWLFEVGKNWYDLFVLRSADRQGNAANKDKPAWTKKMFDQLNRIQTLIRETPVIFREDINISPNLINKISEEYGSKETIYSNLLGLINEEPGRNTECWLQSYVQKVYKCPVS